MYFFISPSLLRGSTNDQFICDITTLEMRG
jgi:hypothetical protein